MEPYPNETDTQMEREIEMAIQKKKWHHLQDLTAHCFLLSSVMLICFTVASFMLVASCASTFGNDEPGKYKLADLMEQSGEEKDYAILLICLTILSIIAAIISLLLVIATYDKSMWKSLPFCLLTVALMMFYLFQLFQLGLCLGTCKVPEHTVPADLNASVKSEFAQNMLRGGATYIFSSMTVLGFLMYAIYTAFKFFLECYRQRLESKERQARRASLRPLKSHQPPAEPVPHRHQHHRPPSQNEGAENISAPEANPLEKTTSLP